MCPFIDIRTERVSNVYYNNKYKHINNHYIISYIRIIYNIYSAAESIYYYTCIFEINL